jgi:hypothetical protein
MRKWIRETHIEENFGRFIVYTLRQYFKWYGAAFLYADFLKNYTNFYN